GALGTPPTLSGTARLVLDNLSVADNFLSLPAGRSSLTFALPDLRNLSNVTVTPVNLGNLLDFQAARVGDFADLVGGLASALGQFRTAAFFGQPLPFAPGRTLGDVFDFFRVVQDRLGRLNFTSAQALTAQLAAVFGLGGANLVARYDAATHEVTW